MFKNWFKKNKSTKSIGKKPSTTKIIRKENKREKKEIEREIKLIRKQMEQAERWK
ncbi:hypothetical protein [Sporosarcina cyprini]|uniref:hypothetical protein n=1 Tax=Sporosarcina cyprini TaxID=2910523 RepID=UPI001EDD9950|nr:hypothetical protein [Sporosarcina cyprini]MCG3088931.1 hypothetical protein [Sporosarcina cyprini]